MNWNSYLQSIQETAFWSKSVTEMTAFEIMILFSIAMMVYIIITGELDL